MELLTQLIDVVLHLDQHLQALVASHGAWVYLILFVIVFCETGLVVTPLAIRVRLATSTSLGSSVVGMTGGSWSAAPAPSGAASAASSTTLRSINSAS